MSGLPLFIMGGFWIDPLWLIIVGPTLLLAGWASTKTRSAFGRYSRVANSSGMTGAEAAARMLHGQGLQVVGSSDQARQMDNAVAIEGARGFLSDHYDPRSRVLRLSPDVYQGRSLSAVGVACHEAGHALQDAKGYAPLAMRTALVPTASFGSNLAFPLIFIGFLITYFSRSSDFANLLIWGGVILFGITVLFQLITLPVEYDASRRAKVALADLGVIRGREEERGVATVLDAAALTYVAAAVTAIAQLLYFLMIILGNRR